MPDRTKHEAVLSALESAGYGAIQFSITPPLFRFQNGQAPSELEFSRAYFDSIPLDKLTALIHEKIAPALKQHAGYKLHVAAGYMAIIALRANHPRGHGKPRAEQRSSAGESTELSD